MRILDPRMVLLLYKYKKESPGEDSSFENGIDTHPNRLILVPVPTCARRSRVGSEGIFKQLTQQPKQNRAYNVVHVWGPSPIQSRNVPGARPSNANRYP